jgi:hypothetical protein
VDTLYIFLDRLSELKVRHGAGAEATLLTIPELLKGQATLWLRNNKSSE